MFGRKEKSVVKAVKKGRGMTVVSGAPSFRKLVVCGSILGGMSLWLMAIVHIAIRSA